MQEVFQEISTLRTTMSIINSEKWTFRPYRQMLLRSRSSHVKYNWYSIFVV